MGIEIKINMDTKTYNRLAAILFFLGLPLLLFALEDIPKRTFLKESISVLFILAYFLMLGQFFLSRGNRKVLKPHRNGKVVKLHKIIGYIFVPLLLLHPFLIVVPRISETGIEPGQAFSTLLTTWDSNGIILGMIAWCLMLILGITSILRKKLGLKHTSWRVFHGILSILFISLATWHALDLGRHTNLSMSIYMVATAGIGVLLLLKTYLFASIKPQENNDES